MTKFESLQTDFERAILRLAEVLKEDKTDIVRDSAIKRFEMAFDLSWKTVKAFLEEYHNITCVSPRNCFKEAFRVGVIDYDEYWIKMIDLRNDTVHSYSEILAEKIYRDFPEALGFFKKLAEIIKKAEAG